VTLTFSQTSVSADGLSVVKGEIETTEYGKPDGGRHRHAAAEAQRNGRSCRHERRAESPSAVPREAGSGRQAVLVSPLATPVDVMTNADGVYDFTDDNRHGARDVPAQCPGWRTQLAS